MPTRTRAVWLALVVGGVSCGAIRDRVVEEQPRSADHGGNGGRGQPLDASTIPHDETTAGHDSAVTAGSRNSDGCGGADGDRVEAYEADSSDLAGAGGGNGASAEGGAPADCEWGAPFVMTRALGSLNAAAIDDYDIQLTADELSAYFVSRRLGNESTATGARLWRASRSSRSQRFSSPELVGAGEPLDLFDFAISGDLLTLYFSRLSGLWRATRTSTSHPFAGLSPLAAVDDVSLIREPAFAAASGDLYFVDYSGPSSNGVVLRTTGSASDLSAAHLVFELGGSPVLSPDELTIYITSTSTRSAECGNLTWLDQDIFVATRPSVSSPFGTPVEVKELTTDRLEQPNWLSPDGCRLYLSRQRYPWRVDVEAEPDFDLFVAEKARPAR